MDRLYSSLTDLTLELYKAVERELNARADGAVGGTWVHLVHKLLMFVLLQAKIGGVSAVIFDVKLVGADFNDSKVQCVLAGVLRQFDGRGPDQITRRGRLDQSTLS